MPKTVKQPERRVTAPQRHRKQLTPVLVDAFAEWGYRKATTAKLAERCGVSETELYRVWPSKRAMFLAAIDHVFDQTRAEWAAMLEPEGKTELSRETLARRLLSHQAMHQGDRGFYRIVFAGLSEMDSPDVRRVLRRMYRRFHEFLTDLIEGHRRDLGVAADSQRAALDAWAIVGLATVSDLTRSLGLLSPSERQTLIETVGADLLEEPS